MKKIKLYVFTVLVACLGFYSYAWYLGANKLEMALLDHVKILEEKGYRVAYSAIRVNGFPLQINLEIDDVFLEAPAPIAASLVITGTLHGYASILDPETVRFEAHNGIDIKTSLRGEGDNTVLRAQTLEAHMPFPMPLKDFDLIFKKAHIGALDITAETLELGLKLHKNDRDLDQYSFKMTQVDPRKDYSVGLPRLIDQVSGTLSLTGRISVDLPFNQAIEKWYKSGGSADISLLSIHWGDLKIDTNGTLSLDEALQPLAAFSAEIQGLDTLLDNLKNLGFIHENILPLLKTSLSFFKETQEGESNQSREMYHKIAITVQDNDVIVGSIPILKLPSVNWLNLGQ